MKFLFGEAIEKRDEANGLLMTFKVINTVTKAQLMTLLTDSSLSGRARYVQAILLKCAESLSVDGEVFDPVQVATFADISDPATLKTLIAIGNLATEVYFPKDDSAKK